MLIGMYLLIQCYKFGCKGTTKIAYMQIFGRFLANKNKKIALTSDFSYFHSFLVF